MAKYVIDLEPAHIEMLKRHLGYVRCWIDGFEASGKKGPAASHADSLRKAQLLLDGLKAK